MHPDTILFNDTHQLLFSRLFISLGLGFLIGLEREYAKGVVEKEEQFAGVRTYPFIALMGFLSAFLAERYGEWAFIAGFAGCISMVIATYLLTAKQGSYGITTELSAILAFLIGAVVFQGEVLLAVIITVIVTSLLSLKMKLHTFISTLTAKEIRAFIQFVIISAVVLPFLPEDDFGPGWRVEPARYLDDGDRGVGHQPRRLPDGQDPRFEQGHLARGYSWRPGLQHGGGVERFKANARAAG